MSDQIEVKEVAVTTHWWVATDALPRGSKLMGPFATRDGAFKGREYMESREGHHRYWVQSELAAAQPAPEGER